MSYASVIVTFNRKDLLKKAINSVLTQTYAPTYVIVVDNHSTDGTDELMTTFASRKEIVYVRTSENVGGSMGFYLGLKRAYDLGTDWVSLSDDDAIFETHYFEKLLVASKQKPEVKCFTGTVRFPNETIQDVHRKKLLNTATLREKPIDQSRYAKNFWLDIFTFVGVLLAHDLIKTIGFPEKNYFIWNDDTEYSLRVAKQTRILNISDATVYHYNNVNVGQRFSPTWKEYYGIRNRLQMEKKHSSNRAWLIPSNCAFILRRLCGMILKKDHWKYSKYLFNQLKDGYRDGIKGVTGKNRKYLP